MQFVLLCAGKSTRTWPLTVNKPKPLLKVAGKTILEHNLEQIKQATGKELEEIILVVGFEKAQLIEHTKKVAEKLKLKISFIEQNNPQGTGQALHLCEKKLKDKFIVMNGDDFYSAKDLKNCVKKEFCVLAAERQDAEKFGVIEAEKNLLKGFVEKPLNPKSKLVGTGLYVLNKKIFKHKLQLSERKEFELVDYLKFLVTEKEKVFVEKVLDYWFPIAYPWDLLKANEFFVGSLKENKIEGIIEEGVHIKGKISLGKGSTLKSGTYIEGNVFIGENCEIGPNCFIRGNTSIMNGCKIGQAVEVKNSVIENGTKIPHLSYVGDSVIGENCNLGAGTITANLRHDHANVKSILKGEKIDSGRKKLGAIFGDNCKIGINSSFYPGVKLSPRTTTLPGEIVKEDK